MSRAWAEVDLEAVRHNVRAVQSCVGDQTAVMAVVKANAYGHGAPQVARSAVQAGAAWLGVATPEEGAELRGAGLDAPICLLAAWHPAEAPAILRAQITPLVGSMEQALALHRAAQADGVIVPAHVELDTGMGRSGFLPSELPSIAASLASLSDIRFTGAATHFASAEDDPEYTLAQAAAFRSSVRALTAAGLPIELQHAANSAALLQYPEVRLGLVRPGLLLYGIAPRTSVPAPPGGVRPVLSLMSHIAIVRDLPEGHAVSYGQTVRLQRSSRVATIPIGYGDGYPRAVSNRGQVLIAGRRAPILGRVCMDVLVADITDIPDAGAESSVVLLGKDRGEEIRVEEMAAWAETTEHDVTTRLTDRIPRIYRGGAAAG